jgi:hypothetical protein
LPDLLESLGYSTEFRFLPAFSAPAQELRMVTEALGEVFKNQKLLAGEIIAQYVFNSFKT